MFSTYPVGQEIEKGKIYQSVQNGEPEPVEASNTEALHHQLFPIHTQHKREPISTCSEKLAYISIYLDEQIE